MISDLGFFSTNKKWGEEEIAEIRSFFAFCCAAYARLAELGRGGLCVTFNPKIQSKSVGLA